MTKKETEEKYPPKWWKMISTLNDLIIIVPTHWTLQQHQISNAPYMKHKYVNQQNSSLSSKSSFYNMNTFYS
jgi:hypothetical protein